MKKIWVLAKVMLTSSGLISSGLTRIRADRVSKGRKYIWSAFVILFCFGTVGGIIGVLSYNVTKTLMLADIQETLLQLSIPAIGIGILIFSVFTVVSVFFLSSDNETLLPLPIKPDQLLSARFIIALIETYLLITMFLDPVCIGYGIATHAGAAFYILSFINLIFIPFIPISLLLIITVLVFQKINTTNHRDGLTYVFVALILVAVFFVSTFISNAMATIRENPAEIVEHIKPVMENLLLKVSPWMPNVYFATRALVGHDLSKQIWDMFLAVLYSIIFVAVAIQISKRLYLNTIKTTNQKPHKHNSNVDKKSYLKKRKQFESMLRNEWKELFRSPTFVMNIVVPALSFPIVFIVAFGVGFKTNDNQALETLIKQIRASMFSPDKPLGFFIILALLVFISSMVSISSTAISRMGKSAYFLKSIPASNRQIINSKIFFGVAINLLSSLIIIIFMYIKNIYSLGELTLILFIAIPIFIFLNYYAIHIDVRHPHLGWINESQATKQNSNAIIYMFGSWGIACILCLIGYAFSFIEYKNLGYMLGIGAGILAIGLDVAYNVHIKRHMSDYLKAII